MELSTFSWALMAAACGAALTAAIRNRPSNAAPTQSKLRARAMFSPALYQFLRELEEAVPEIRFCPQVGMSALVEPQEARGAQDIAQALGTFGQKRVAVVATARSDGAVIALIELARTDSQPPREHRRDAITAEAGYLTFRWDPRRMPGRSEIRHALLTAAAQGQHRRGPESWGETRRHQPGTI